MVNLTLSRACEDRLKSGMTLTGAFQAERIYSAHQCLSDLGACLEQLTTSSDCHALYMTLGAIAEHVDRLQLEAGAKTLELQERDK